MSSITQKVYLLGNLNPSIFSWTFKIYYYFLYAIILNREMLVKWESYNSIDEFIQDILTIEEIYCRNIKDLKL